jgi:hypothetical protein
MCLFTLFDLIQLLNITSSLAAELAAVRVLLEKKDGKENEAESKNSDTESATASATEAVTAAESVSVPLTAAQHINRIRGALKALISSATADASSSGPTLSDDAFKQGCGALLLYIGKVSDNPTVPRYRKIATSNASFKSLVMPMKGHEKVLQSVGFKKQGAYFEWMWAPDSSTSSSTSTKGAAAADASKEEDKVEPCADEEVRSAVLSECVSLLRIGKESGSAALAKEISERESKAEKEASKESSQGSVSDDSSTSAHPKSGADEANATIITNENPAAAPETTHQDDIPVPTGEGTTKNEEVTLIADGSDSSPTATPTATTMPIKSTSNVQEAAESKTEVAEAANMISPQTTASTSTSTKVITTSTDTPANNNDESKTFLNSPTLSASAASDAITSTTSRSAVPITADDSAVPTSSTTAPANNSMTATSSTTNRSRKAAAGATAGNKTASVVVPFDQVPDTNL